MRVRIRVEVMVRDWVRVREGRVRVGFVQGLGIG